MFGYVMPNRDELKIKEERAYRAYYCGLCHEIGRQTHAGRLTLSYDMTFLAMLLDSLYDTQKTFRKRGCLFHPFNRHACVLSPAVAYASKMSILLSYDNFLDKWHDEKNPAGFLGSLMLRRKRKKIAKEYPRQSRAVAEYITALHRCEEENCADMDMCAGLTGEMLAEIYDMNEDEWSSDLKNLGFFIGKFVYLADAYDDFDRDKIKESYNPFIQYLTIHPDTDIKAYGMELLTMMAAEAAKYFERLPLVDNIEILRNTLYSGVFVKINSKHRK